MCFSYIIAFDNQFDLLIGERFNCYGTDMLFYWHGILFWKEFMLQWISLLIMRDCNRSQQISYNKYYEKKFLNN